MQSRRRDKNPVCGIIVKSPGKIVSLPRDLVRNIDRSRVKFS